MSLHPDDRIKALLGTIEDLVWQFADRIDNPPRFGTMGLSALEGAFAELGWSDPHKPAHGGCDEPGCGAWDTCGWPSPAGYRRTCGKHMILGDTGTR